VITNIIYGYKWRSLENQGLLVIFKGRDLKQPMTRCNIQ